MCSQPATFYSQGNHLIFHYYLCFKPVRTEYERWLCTKLSSLKLVIFLWRKQHFLSGSSHYCAIYYSYSLKNAICVPEATVTAWRTVQDSAWLLSSTVLSSAQEPMLLSVAALGLLSITRLAHLRRAKIKSSNEDVLRWIFWQSFWYLQL